MSKVTIIPHFQLILENGTTAILSREDLFALRERIDRWLKRTVESGYLQIQTTVANGFQITVPQLLSFNRSDRFAIPRMIAMLLCREFLPDETVERIGAAFYRNHATVVHGTKRAQDLISVEPRLAAKVDKCRKVLVKELAHRHINTEPDHPVPSGSTDE